MRILFLVIVCLIGLNVNGQVHVDSAYFGPAAVVSGSPLSPHWLHSNQWGIYDEFTSSEVLLHSKVGLKLVERSNFSLKGGLATVVNADWNKSFLHEAYLSGKWRWFDFRVGKEARALNVIDERISSGMFLGSSNARPIPRVDAGIFNYLPLGFTNNWMEVKGGISHGWMNDEAGSQGTSHTLLHEKFAYGRLGNVRIKPYIGLVHSALYGGVLPWGQKIPVDFWPTFFAKGSSKIGGGEETNAAGAHMGLWDFGVYFPIKEWNSQFYYQKPFFDGSGLFLNRFRNKDHVIGLNLNRQGKSWLTNVSMEWVKTDWGSGPGTPDPFDPETETGYYPGSLDDVQAFMRNRFPDVDASGWDDDDLYDFLADQWNHGYQFGGRDNYMNNGLYYNGWSYHGRSTGISLFHTVQQVQRYAPTWVMQGSFMFVNNRVRALHVGGEGFLSERLSWLVKVTGTLNDGSYHEKYYGAFSWEETPNYYFNETKSEVYTLLGLNWQVKNWPNLNIKAEMAYDFGDLYHSAGGKLSIVWSLPSLAQGLNRGL
jgi:hypothetical protein